MAKFIALWDKLALVVPFIERDERGHVLRDQTIIFNKGSKTRDKLIPASLSVSDADTLAHLRAYPGNEANGGSSYKEVTEEKQAPAQKTAPKPAKAAVQAPAEPVAEADGQEEPKAESEESEASVSEYPQVTTVQEAAGVLRSLFPELKSKDVSNAEKVTAFAAQHGITFPSL